MMTLTEIQSIYGDCKEVYRDYEVTLTDAELVKILEETAALSAEIDADKEARLSNVGVFEILRRYEELRNPEIIEGAEQ